MVLHARTFLDLVIHLLSTAFSDAEITWQTISDSLANLLKPANQCDPISASKNVVDNEPQKFHHHAARLQAVITYNWD